MTCRDCIHYKVCGYHITEKNDMRLEAVICDDFMPTTKIKTNLFDEVEEHHNCFVQILRNSVTGECSIGWREEDAV